VSRHGIAPQRCQRVTDARLADITPDDVKAFGKEVFRRLYIETLIHGNTTAEGANEIQAMVERVLAPRPLAEAEKLGSRTLILPPCKCCVSHRVEFLIMVVSQRGADVVASEHIWAFDVPNASEVNGAVTYSLHVGDITDHALRARLQLFGQIVNEPAFDRLRTKEQLGYIVSTSTLARTGSQGFRVMVQSERDPAYVETRIEAFLDSMRGYIEELSDEEYAKHVQSLVQKREEKAKNLGEETRRFWGRIVDMYYEFGKRECEAARRDVLDGTSPKRCKGEPR
jgi:insulysin